VKFFLLLLPVTPLAAQPLAHTPRGPAAAPEALAWSRYAAQSKFALASLDASSAAAQLSPAPAGVADLAFADFFGAIGDRGLEYSEKLRALAGRRVRLVGYMVREQERVPGLFRFAGWPVVVETQGLCSADDTPPSTAYVIMPGQARQLPPWRPGRLILIGTLEFGPRSESDGRNSFVRLLLDEPIASSASPALTVSASP
jgi:hypothetical protein